MTPQEFDGRLASAEPVEVRFRSAKPTRLPRRWDPGDAVLASFTERFGKYLDLDLELAEFCSWHVEKQTTSTDWVARFGQWCAGHAKKVQEQRLQAQDHDDDLGVPLRQAKTSRVDAMTEEQKKQELAAIRQRYENGAK